MTTVESFEKSDRMSFRPPGLLKGEAGGPPDSSQCWGTLADRRTEQHRGTMELPAITMVGANPIKASDNTPVTTSYRESLSKGRSILCKLYRAVD